MSDFVKQCVGRWPRIVADQPMLTATQMATILEAFPRLEMKQRFTRDVCRIVQSRPDTTYDNFARDFGERFVPGYTRPSAVDLLMNSPFEE